MNMAEKITEWMRLRAELAEIERSEHPDIVDGHGRTWSWWKGDLYRHDDMALPEPVVPYAGLPTEACRSNPNYHLCGICRREGTP